GSHVRRGSRRRGPARYRGGGSSPGARGSAPGRAARGLPRRRPDRPARLGWTVDPAWHGRGPASARPRSPKPRAPERIEDKRTRWRPQDLRCRSETRRNPRSLADLTIVETLPQDSRSEMLRQRATRVGDSASRGDKRHAPNLWGFRREGHGSKRNGTP